MCYAGGNKQTPVTYTIKVCFYGATFSRRPNTEVMKNYSHSSKWHIPIIGLVKVVVQSNDTPSLSITSIRLQHFATAIRYPLAPVSFYEKATIIIEHLGSDDVNAVY
jgi:hypothetical protein